MNTEHASGASRMTAARRFVLTIVLLFLLAAPQSSPGTEKPLWELGIGGGFLLMPDYRGSNETRAYALPYPYLVYRGDILKVEDRRVTGRIFKTDRLTLDISGYGSVPVDSDDNEARSGMPDLDTTFELGPALRIKLLDSQEKKYRLSLTLPVRALFSTDFESVRHEGWVFTPRLSFAKGDAIPGTGLYLNVSASAMFADRSYHGYFYEVEPAFAAAARPAYSPSGGYSGSALTVSLGKHYKDFIFSAFVSADFLRGAAFEQSPLVKTKTSLMGGCTVSWIFLKSQKAVPAEEIE